MPSVTASATFGGREIVGQILLNGSWASFGRLHAKPFHMKIFSRLHVVSFVLAAFMWSCSADPEVAKREYLKSGNDYVAQGKTAEAIIQYRNAIQQDARFGEARFKLAEALWATGDRNGAYREYVRAADLLPRDDAAQVRAGQMNLAAGQFEEARSRANKAVEINSKNVQAYILLGNALAGVKDYDAAAAEVQRAIELDPNRSLSFAALGGVRLLQGDRSNAEDSFKRAVAADPKLPQARVALANFYWLSGRVDDAEQTLKDGIALSPREPALNRALAYLYVSTGRQAQAEQPLKVVAEDTKETSARLALASYYADARKTADAIRILDELSAEPATATLGKTRKSALLFAEGKKAEAYALIDEALRKEGADTATLMTKAEFLTVDKKLDDALKIAETAISGNPGSLLAHYGKARIQVARGARDDAIAEYNEVLKLRPRLPIAQAALANLYLAAGRPDDALREAQAALAVNPSNGDAMLVQVRVLLGKRNVTAAKPPLTRLATAYPKSPVVQAQLGVLHALENDRPGARKSFEQALAMDPANEEALMGLVGMDLSEQNARAARTRIESAVAKRPDNVGVLLVAARAYATMMDKPLAEKTLKRAIDVSPSTYEAYDLLGRLYASEGRAADAINEFNKLVERQPNSVAAHTMIGVLLEIENKRDEARKRYEQVLALDSRSPVAANNLAWIYAETGGNLDLALQLAQTAKEQLPDTPEVDDTIGWIYYKKGIQTLAIASFRASVDKDPKNATYQTHLGLAYAKNGDMLKARETLGNALKADPNAHGADEARKVLGASRS